MCIRSPNTWRDVFASDAMAAIIMSGRNGDYDSAEEIAQSAYVIANAMLAEREKHFDQAEEDEFERKSEQ